MLFSYKTFPNTLYRDGNLNNKNWAGRHKRQIYNLVIHYRIKRTVMVVLQIQVVQCPLSLLAATKIA